MIHITLPDGSLPPLEAGQSALDQVPAILTLGKREEDEKTVSVRLLSGEQVHGVPLDSFVDPCTQLHHGRVLETRFAAN
jgi:threonyl-tRNA synthetase